MISDETKQKLWDDLVTYALEQELEQMVSEMPSEEELKAEYLPSPEFEKKMQQLFKQRAKKEKAVRRHKVMKWAAACLIAMIGLSTITITSVEAFRVRFYNMVYETKEKYLDIRFEEKDTEKESILGFEEQVYHPSYLPAGFYVLEARYFDGHSDLIYKNEENTLIYISQGLIDEGIALGIDNEEATMLTTLINGAEANIYQKQYEGNPEEEYTTIFWKNNLYFFKINSTIQLEEIIKIAEGLEK